MLTLLVLWFEIYIAAFGSLILWSLMDLRYNGMNHHQFCVLIEFLHGNWSHLCLPLLRTPSQPQETRDHGLPFYLRQFQILLKVAWSFVISLYMLSMLLFYIISFSVSGVWKSPVDSPPFSYRDPQHGRDLYASPKFNSTATSFFCFGGNNSASNKSTYWSTRMENSTETFSPIALKESGEKRQGTGNGCRLFGIQLLENSNAEESLPTVTLSGRLGDDQSIPSLDAESDQHSEPSNVNRSDIPSVSCDAEKSCLRSPQESQSRQIRSCTKVA